VRSGGGFGIAGMRRAEEEEEDEESETETETEGLWWKKCEPFGEAWSFSGSAARMPNDESEGPYAKPLWWLLWLWLWWLGIGEEEEEGSVESTLLEKTTSSSIRSSLLEKTTSSEEGFSSRGAWDGTPRKRSREERVGCLRLRKRFGSSRSILQVRVRS